MILHRIPFTLAFVLLLFSTAIAQQEGPPRQGARWADQARVTGQISAIRADAVDVLTPDNKTVTVKFTADTRFRKNRAPATLGDFKIGDMVFAIGEQKKDGTFTIRMLASGMPGAGGPPQGGMMGGMSREDLGKKFVMGQVKNIDETKITILRPDNVEQVIEVDESTSFRNTKNESVTLADIKIGDQVGGRGELKNGVFVPEVLRIGMPRPRGERNGPNSKPDVSAPANPK